MSRRTSIVKALADKLNGIDGTQGTYKSNIYGNAYPYLKFWDEVNDFPAIFMAAGTEVREYHPSNLTWGYLTISIKIYTKGEDSGQLLEDLLEDVETVIDANRQLTYDVDNNLETTEILLQSIVTDDGLLAPYAIGEMNIQVRYLM